MVILFWPLRATVRWEKKRCWLFHLLCGQWDLPSLVPYFSHLKFCLQLFLSHPYGWRCVPTALTNVVVVCQCVWPWFTFLLKSLAYRLRHAYYSACVFYTLIYIDVLFLPRQRKRLEILIRLADLKLPADRNILDRKPPHWLWESCTDKRHCHIFA